MGKQVIINKEGPNEQVLQNRPLNLKWIENAFPETLQQDIDNSKTTEDLLDLYFSTDVPVNEFVAEAFARRYYQLESQL